MNKIANFLYYVREKMGICKSKSEKPDPIKPTTYQDDEYENYELRLLRKTIKEDPDSFILNNLMMCIQFFKNYEEDIIQNKETLALALSYEAKLNKILPSQKHVLLPDILQEYIAHDIIFTSMRQTGDRIIEPLQSVRIYVVYDNIEITERDYQPEYSSLNNGITYNMRVQPCEQHPGYVRLRRLDETPYPRNLSKEKVFNPSLTVDDEINNYCISDESVYNQRNSNMMKVDYENRAPSSDLSSDQGYRSEPCDSICSSGYHTVTSPAQINCNINHDKMKKSNEIYPNAIIPTQCFKKVKINNENKMQKKKEQLQNMKQVRLDIFNRQYDCNVSYTSSEMFMKHFVNFFINQLTEPLGFKPDDLNHVENSVIHCDKMIELHSHKLRIESYEVTPTIWLQWPEIECVQEWLDRARSTWPTYNDISKIKDFGCYVIPESSLPKKRNLLLKHQNIKKNIHEEIEWQLAFPSAERYLETCMTRSQVQVYLIALMLHKTFLRPILDTMHGLTTSHIRNKLFWLIEEDDRPSKWPDNRIGECLIKLLNSLYRCISQNEPTLPDYFVRDKNMFAKVPYEYLLHSQKQLKRIIENPIMYVFHAMENIHHSNKFFPRLDFRELFEILTVQPWLAEVNPAQNISKMITESHREEIYNRSDEFRKIFKKRDQQNYSTRVITSKTLITPRKATDFIVDISDRCAKLEGLRLATLLNFFIRHFIKMAECCHRNRSYHQKDVYLNQADRLSIILSDWTRYKDDASFYRDKINTLRKKVATNSTRLSNEPPETPKRNAEPIFNTTLKDRYKQQCAEQIIPMQLKDEEPQSSHKYIDKNTKVIIHEIQFKDEKSAEKNVKIENTTSNEDSYMSKKPISKNQSDESVSDTIQRVVSLGDHLSETTNI